MSTTAANGFGALVEDACAKPHLADETVRFGNYDVHYKAMRAWFATQTAGGWKAEAVIQGSLMVYGWMPTILEVKKRTGYGTVNIDLAEMVAKRLEDRDDNHGLRFVNGSLTGTSKFLHFWRPDYYAIWDSRIYKAITGRSVQHFLSVKYDTQYQIYCDTLRKLSEGKSGGIRLLEKKLFIRGGSDASTHRP
jgi:hypothetical protein